MSHDLTLPQIEADIGRPDCPYCKGETVTLFGFGAGGYGPYTMCLDDLCGWVVNKPYAKE